MSTTSIGAYMGKVLRVDLTSGQHYDEAIPEDVLRQYIGGTGIGVKYLYDEVPPSVDWDSPDNRLIVATGPLNGTVVGGSGAFSVVTKGCLTNGAISVQANGFLGAFIKFSGYDIIVIHGVAAKPVYLYIHDGTAELKDASHLWGNDTWQTEELIKQDLEKKERELSVFSIGPAGENLVKFACLVGDKGHVAAHSGVGAVLGSKKLKAIAVDGRKRAVPVKDRHKLSLLSKQLFQKVTSTSHIPFHKWGTLMDANTAKGRMLAAVQPVKNYTTVFFPEAVPFNAEEPRSKYEIDWTPCWACKFHHCHQWKITEGPHAGFVGDEPEYEGMAAWTSLIGQADNEEAFILCNVVDRLGMDTNEAGWLISWVMECYEKGILSKKHTDGLDMTWGNVEAVKALLYKIANRDGFGDILAEGVMRASQHLGVDASKLGIYTKKGNTPKAHDDRRSWAQILDTCTSDMGTQADSVISLRPTDVGLPRDTNVFSPDGASSILAKARGYIPIIDSLVICLFNAGMSNQSTLVDLSQILNAVTGWNFNEEELKTVGIRIINLLRAFNIRHGVTADLDLPSERYASAPTNGPFEGITAIPVWDQMLRNYYELMGWDKDDGKPLPETLRLLGLGQIIEDIW
ncbi:aldehyde ferredoxin oxidoreductase family protein [Chloroflexota bacterium]